MDLVDRLIASLPAPPERVTGDSREVTPGAIFVAIRGGSYDGHQFIAEAVKRGAVAVVGERPAPALPVPYLQVPEARSALAYLAALVHGFPTRRLTLIGVTGTDGKTTTVSLINEILRAAGLRAGMISTVQAVLGDRVAETGLHVTTPDAPAVQGYLAEMVAAGLTHCILEATSHGLAQHRVSSCDLDVAVVTNVTHEHLDYHGSYDAYLAAKAMLIEGLATAARKPGQPKVAVLNADDQAFAALRSLPADRQLTYSLAGPADLVAQKVASGMGGTTFELRFEGQIIPISTRLAGEHNVSNALAAAGAALGLEPRLPVAAIQEGLAALAGIPGRMERIDAGQPFLVVVDFAHTPNALQRAIETGRAMIGGAGRVITVFGSAGLRDKAKRRLMAEISARGADLTFLTAEDPRTESLAAILDEMAAGCLAAGGREGESFFRIPDRLRAIYRALTSARARDIVLVCGKGHEQSMCFGEQEYPWDDRAAVRRALRALLASEPLPPSGLPTAGE
jgi:UDP-N-acetylmuramoyl-L-alanyl-D-glutamate--2,6-diaminopimelate ligase